MLTITPVMVSVLASGAVDHGFIGDVMVSMDSSPDQVQPKTIKFVFVASDPVTYVITATSFFLPIVRTLQLLLLLLVISNGNRCNSSSSSSANITSADCDDWS
jgi:hypothetical protein